MDSKKLQEKKEGDFRRLKKACVDIPGENAVIEAGFSAGRRCALRVTIVSIQLCSPDGIVLLSWREIPCEDAHRVMQRQMHGRRLPPGIYICRFKTGGGRPLPACGKGKREGGRERPFASICLDFEKIEEIKSSGNENANLPFILPVLAPAGEVLFFCSKEKDPKDAAATAYINKLFVLRLIAPVAGGRKTRADKPHRPSDNYDLLSATEAGSVEGEEQPSLFMLFRY